MAAPRLQVQLTMAGIAVAVILAADSSGLLSGRPSMILDDAAQLGGGILAALACAWAARRTTGAERASREPAATGAGHVTGRAPQGGRAAVQWRLMAIGMAGWSVGQLIWSWYQVFAHTAMPSPSLADVGYLTLPVFALAALLTGAADEMAGHRRRLAGTGSAARSRLVLVLDGLVVVGSLLILTWATSLGAVVRAGAPTTLAFVVAIAYPATDLILVVIVVLLLATRPVPLRLRPQLALLGLGLVGISVSDSIYAYLVASGADRMPPITNAGFVAGPILVAIAALHPGGTDAPGRRESTRTIEWAHLLLPYLPLAAVGVLILIQQVTDRQPDNLEVYLGMIVVALVVIRQMITLIDNHVLLARVSEARQRLQYQAYHDPLTGLVNRALFRGRLADAVERNRREHRPMALFFVDLDDFKLVNDSLGHGTGDRVLQEAGQRLLACVRERDTVARLGGDEFGVLVDGDLEHPERVGERLLSSLRRPFEVDGRTVSLGASVGAAVPDGTEPGLTADALLRRADAAMYAGKRRGKGLLVVYGPDTADGYDHPDLPTLLAEALLEPAQHGLDVLYQPIVRLSDGTRVAVEALARWTHPLIGPVPPTVFVAVAERAGLIGSLDDFVLDRSCREVAARLAAGDDVVVHVNISAGRLGNPDLEVVVAELLARHALPARHLVLEVTETSRIPDPVAAATSAQRLRDMGVRLALDDFGTGYSTLAQLHLLPLDVIKLDQTLTSVDPRHPDGVRARALCRSVLTIAAELHMTVIAEGVETAGQAAHLAEIGCRYVQGHLYGHPAPLAPNSPAVASEAAG